MQIGSASKHFMLQTFLINLTCTKFHAFFGLWKIDKVHRLIGKYPRKLFLFLHRFYFRHLKNSQYCWYTKFIGGLVTHFACSFSKLKFSFFQIYDKGPPSTIEILDLGRSPSLGVGVQEGWAHSDPKMIKVLLYIILNASYTIRTYFKWPAHLV